MSILNLTKYQVESDKNIERYLSLAVKVETADFFFKH